MATKHPITSQSPSASTSILQAGRTSRRGSLISLSSRPPMDKERMSRALDQIHNTASQSETLTTFNEFTPAPSSGSGVEAKGLAGELQGGLSGLYSRFRASVGGVRDLVGAVTTGEEKGVPEDRSISSPDVSIYDLEETSDGVKIPNVAVSSSTTGITTTPRFQSSLAPPLANAPINDQSQPTTGPRGSSSATPTSPNTPVSSSISGGLKSPPPLTRATTSTAADPRLAEIHVVAIKDTASISEQNPESYRREPSSRDVSLVRRDEETQKVSNSQGASRVRRDLESFQLSPPEKVSSRSSNHKRSSAQVSGSRHPAGSDDGLPAVKQAEELLYSTISIAPQDRKETDSREDDLRSPLGPDDSFDNLIDRQHTLVDGQTFHNSIVTSGILIANTKERNETAPADLPKRSSSNNNPPNPRLDRTQTTDGTSALPRISQSHLPGFKISRASSSDNDGQGQINTPTHTNIQDQSSANSDEALVLGRQRLDLPATANEGPANAGNMGLSQIRSKVLSKDYWMKDENAKDCFYCGGAFSTFRRKHHCRTCGQIFDAKCTSLVSGRQFGQSGNLRVCKPCEAIINGYDLSDGSDEDTAPPDLSCNHQNETVAPAGVHGEAEATTPGNTSQQTVRSHQHRNLLTPTMAIPATRRSAGSGHQTAVLEIDAERTVVRPSSSRSLRTSVSGRPFSSNYKRYHSRPYNLRNFRPSVEDKAPFHGNPTNEMHKETRRSAFHNDSIIDPDLAPYLSDEASSGDEQMSISAAMTSEGLSRSHDNDRSGVGGLLAAVRKGRLRLGDMSISGVTFASRDADDTSINSSRAANPPRSARKRNLSFTSNVHHRPLLRPYKGSTLPSELAQENLNSPETASYGPVGTALDGSKLTRSSSMIGASAPAVELNNASLQHVRKLLRQLLQDSGVSKMGSWERALIPILLQATDDVNPDVQNGDDLDIRHYVKLKKIPGGRPSGTSYVSGLVFTKNLALKSMPRTIPCPNIVIVTFPLEYARHRQHFMSLEPVIRQEREFLENLVNRIATLQPQLLLVQQKVSGLALELLEKANIATAYNVKPSIIEAVSRCTQTRIISSIDKLAIKPAHSGKCSSFDLKTYVYNGRKKTYMYVSGCPKELGCTIVLRGADNDTLAKMKRITEFMVYVVYNLKLETCLMRDEFALIPSTTDGATLLARRKELTIPADFNPALASDALFEISNKSRGHHARLEHASADVSNAEVLSGENETFPQLEEARNVTSDDIQLPEDIPAPTFYGDMVEKHKTKILSASPFVEFVQPYLLMRAREQERRLVYLKRLRDQDSLEEQTADEKGKPPPQKFDLIKPEMVHATIQGTSKKVREVLHAVHDAEYDKALHNYQTQKRQWETYISGNINLFDPYAHQNIAVLYSVVCTVTSVPCSGPDLLALGFYNEHETEAEFEADCTLGQYVEDLCFGANTVCTANGCERKMFEHHRQYVHGEAQLSVFVQNYPCRLRGMQDTIMMWSCCRVCGNETQVMPMSDNTWKYSYGKYLELSFWSSHLHARADVCPHDLHRDHVRYFGFRNMAIRVQYDHINLLEIIVPRMRITWKVDNDLRLKNDLFSKIEERLNRFMGSVKARIQGINTDSVVPEKSEACKTEVEKLMKRADEEHQFLTKKLQDKYMSSKYYEIVPLNRAIRATMEKVTEWDRIFEDFDSDFFPSEKDIRRLATLQLKKLFLDREGSVSTLPSPRESLTTPSAGTELSEKTAAEASIRSLPKTEEMLSEKTHDVLTSAVEEHSGRSSITANQNEGSVHGDETKKSRMMSKDPSSEDFMQDPSMQHVRHLDLAMPSSFPERQSADQPCPLPESRPVSPTTTRTGDPLSLESPSKPASVGPDVRDEGHQDSKSSLGVGVTSDRDLASGIPRLSEAIVRRSGMTSSPPLYRTQSQPAHLRRDQNVGLGKSNPGLPPTSILNSHVKGLGEPSPSSSMNLVGSGGEKKVPGRLSLTVMRAEKNATRQSLIPRSIASRRKDSTVSTLAKHFEQLSREFEKERVRERRQRAAKSRHARAYPMASSKPITQVYKNVHEAVEERDPSDEDLLDEEQSHTSTFAPKSTIENMAQSTVNQTPGEGFHAEETPAEVTEIDDNAQTVSLTASDVEGEGDRSDEDHTVIDNTHIPSTNAEHHIVSPTEAQLDLKIELPKHERSSLMTMLTNFWAERSASGWTALAYPLGPSDHVFVDSDIIVREDEPSSLIALALDCEDYQAKLESIRTHGGHRPSGYEKPSTTNLTGENAEHIDVERSLLRSTGTHLKYQFQEGSARMACKIFFAEQFDAVRKKCGVSERIIESLSRCLKWDSKGGKTKSVFLKTLDDRLVLKSLSQIEVQTFLSFAPAYFQIMSEALFHELPSVIAKMLGFYQIIIKNPATGIEFNWFLLVMENLFYDRTPTRIFDLKGSMRNRKIQSTGEENEVLLDENMVEFIYENPLFAREHSKKLLRASVWNDTLFLARQNVMDYSLMIAIDENRKELVVGIIDCIRTYTWDKKLESWIKDRGFAGGGRNRPTVTSPKEYKSRFREAMARYVLQAPNCWHQFSTQHFQKRPLKIDPTTESKEGDQTEAEVEVVGI
ncbi:MAG: 1-phosphatidylinositol-3-phosphate 5-kinase [Pleopsidium flavum]|nr:MAG: 1-phosphatidylinositol-3-phosphate 5-kinase [Pleopsidium flavum]